MSTFSRTKTTPVTFGPYTGQFRELYVANHVDSKNYLPNGQVNTKAQGRFLRHSIRSKVLTNSWKGGSTLSPPWPQKGDTGRWNSTLTGFPSDSLAENEYDLGFTASRYLKNFLSADNKAYGRFYRGKNGLLTGSASLGVSLASWKQSRDMIAKRLGTVATVLDRGLLELNRNNATAMRKLRRRAENNELLANDILEVNFGWVPLVEDLNAAFTTVMSPVNELGGFWHTGRGGVRDSYQWSTGFGSGAYGGTAVRTLGGQWSTTYAAWVEIDNPHSYLLNRAGLVNPFQVAWDLVPWSFVAGMFINVNSLLSTLTDRVGLRITNESVTRTFKGAEWYAFTNGFGSKFNTLTVYSSKQRLPGTAPTVTLETKVPKFDWNLALTAGSLVVQKIQRINKLLGVVL